MLGLSDTELIQQAINLSASATSKKEEFWGGDDTRFMKVVHADLSAPEPIVTFKVRTHIGMANPTRTAVHGGCVVTMMDNATSWSRLAWPTNWENATEIKHGVQNMRKVNGPSRNLNCTFLRPVPVDQDIFIECKVRSKTRRYCSATMDMKDSNGKLLTTGIHDMSQNDIAKL